MYIIMMCVVCVARAGAPLTSFNLVGSKNTRTLSVRTIARNTQASRLQATHSFRYHSVIIYFVSSASALFFIFLFSSLSYRAILQETGMHVRGHGGRRSRNGALPPRSGYETLRNGALGSVGSHFLMLINA